VWEEAATRGEVSCPGILEDESQIDKNNWIVKVAFSERMTDRKQIDELDNIWLVEDGK
jgi:hypothetical protein